MKLSYKLLKKIPGTKTIREVATLQSSSPVSDICYMPGLGIVYIAGDKIEQFNCCYDGISGGKIESEANDIPSFESVAGVGHLSRQNVFFVAENGGRSVKSWGKDRQQPSHITRGQPEAKLNKLLRKIRFDEKVFIVPVGKYEFFMAIPSVRKVFHFKDSSLFHVAGDGRCRFANGSDPVHSSIGYPSGMGFYDETLLLSDSFKNVVRAINGNKMDILWGHPKKKILHSPSKLVVQKDMLYIQCDDGIKTYSLARRVGGEKHTYKSDSIVSIASDLDKGLLILEESKDA